MSAPNSPSSDDDAAIAVPVAEPVAAFPTLSKIWDDQYCEKCDVGGSAGWKCLRCGESFKPVHHTRAVAHFAKIPAQGVQVCSAQIPELEYKRYVDLWTVTRKRKTEIKMVSMTITEDKEERLETASKRLFDESNKKPKIPSEMQQYLRSAGLSNSPTKRGGQPAIDTAFENMVQTNITHMNHAKMDMAVASFFHESNIPFNVVGSSSFKLMLSYARLVGKDYKPPNRNSLGTTLLDINHKNCIEHNQENLCREADVFGLSWLSDGATIGRMPLINVLGLCADSPPTCVAIEDCSGHMSAGGRKDARYIAELMEGIIQPYDPDKSRSTLFWFDGASNVQKAGKILEAKFPRSYTLHGGEHVVALFFSDIAKIFEIKVMYYVCLMSYASYYSHFV